LFAEMPLSQCRALQALVFTPDGTRLRAGRFISDDILEFDSEGNHRVVLNASDGINGPTSGNGLSYDGRGDLYVVNYPPRNILRFPGGTAPGSVFADAADGIINAGGIAFAADGNMYYLANRGVFDEVLLFSPNGQHLIFDGYGPNVSPVTLAADRVGNVFLSTHMGDVYRYRAGDPGSRELVVSTDLFGGVHVMALSLDERRLYVASGNLFVVNIDGGTVKLLGEVPSPVGDTVTGVGIAVAPLRPGDFNRNGDLDQDDFVIMVPCLSGPSESLPDTGCVEADSDGDGDLDLRDVAAFFEAFDHA